jgi:hypothetical protein
VVRGLSVAGKMVVGVRVDLSVSPVTCHINWGQANTPGAEVEATQGDGEGAWLSSWHVAGAGGPCGAVWVACQG